MYKRLLPLLLLLLLLPLAASARELSFTVAPDTLRPGKTERISFTTDQSGQAKLEVLDLNGAPAAVIRQNISAAQGENHLTWDGMLDAETALPAGNYWLTLTMGGEMIHAPLVVGPESPQILSVSAPDSLWIGEELQVTVDLNMPGTLTLRIKTADNQWHTILEANAPAGESAHIWDGNLDGQALAPARYDIQLRLTDETGFSGTIRQIFVEMDAVPTPTSVPTPTPAPTPVIVIPSAVTTQADEGLNYWTLPMGEMNEAAIWEVMMQPIVVLDGEQKEVYRLRKTPDDSAKKENIVGEITYASQGVHILETLDNGWTLIEAHNSSYGPDCDSRRGYGVTDELIQGYVKTSLLKTIEPRTDYGLLIDKLEQKMYIFSEGKCIGTLLVSTGLNNKTQSWNETPAGEFLMVSRTGGFPAGNLWCAYGMRINGGCLIHEVPYIGNADTPADRRDYSSTVKLLGKKASHGCIRVQKAKNEEGQNIKWLWDNIKVNTKVLIWDDTGRLLSYPDDATPLYYNPNGGKNYHEDQYCSAVKDRYLPLTEFTYGEFETDQFKNLTPCNTCARIMRKGEIDAINKENGF
ncbi:MAG: L,D-transpeptidase family protein [Clostridiales bacterium]|nr:L,D-transpeptidase family protein [Clostridiales bacterium]